MKNCKKLIALVLAVVMAFSVAVVVAGATSESEPSSTTEDLSYVYPTIETQPESEQDISDLLPGLGEDLSGIGETGKEMGGVVQRFVQMFYDFFDSFYRLLESISGLLFKSK